MNNYYAPQQAQGYFLEARPRVQSGNHQRAGDPSGIPHIPAPSFDDEEEEHSGPVTRTDKPAEPLPILNNSESFKFLSQQGIIKIKLGAVFTQK